MRHALSKRSFAAALLSPCLFALPSGPLRAQELLLPATPLLLACDVEADDEAIGRSRTRRLQRGLGERAEGRFAASRAAAAQEPSPPRPPQSSRPWYRHVSSTDVWQPTAFWYTDRDTLLGQTAADAWDPLRIINTDRPDFTDVATVVGDGTVQLETGFLRVVRKDDATRTKVDAGPNALLRLGVGDRFEWRIKWRGYVHQKVTDSAGDRGDVNGLADVEVGFKYVLHEQEDLVPMQTIVARLGVPVGGDDVSANRFEPGLSYIYNWQVRRWWFFRGATGVDLFHQPAPSFPFPGANQLAQGRDKWLEISQAVSSYFQITTRLGSFVEWFLFSRHGSVDDHVDHFHNYGLYLYATPDLQFDARIGWRFGDHVDQAFWGAGVSMRF